MFVELGEIVNAVGLRGEIKVLVTGNFDEDILRSKFLKLERPSGEVLTARCRRDRPKGGTLIVSLEGFEDRDAAESLVGGRLGFAAADYEDAEFPRGDHPAAFVYLDCEVVTTAGEKIGRVDNVLTLPANWVLQVIADDEQELLVPVIEDVIREVDRENGRVVIEVVEGLFDDDSDD